jgi:hypothetical protein
MQGAGVAPFVRFMNACGVRNHEVANEFNVAVFGRCANTKSFLSSSDARDGSILQNHER